MRKHFIYYLAVILIIGAFGLSACGLPAKSATPSSTPLFANAIYTVAYQTVIAQLTQQAPTATFPPTLFFTDTPTLAAMTATATPIHTMSYPTASSCARATFIKDVTIPDGTQMTQGQAFTKTWRVQNSGTCTWTTSFKLVFSSGNSMGGQTTHMPNSVAVGQNVDISVDMVVPNSTGTLIGNWVLQDDTGQPFGPVFFVNIVVGAISPTPTGPTLTPTITNTPKPTKTPTITKTPKPTKTK